MRWPKATLGECATLVNGRAYKQEELLDSGTPVLRIQNLNGGDRWYYSDLSLPQDKYCDKGDLLFAWSASFGPYLWNSPRAIYHYHIWKVLPGKSLDKGFLYHLLGFLTARVKSESHGASMLHMTKARMEALEIPLPPLEEQRCIAAILDKRHSLAEMVRRRGSLQEDLWKAEFVKRFGNQFAHQSPYPLAKLAELASTSSGGTPRREVRSYFGGSIPWIKSGELSNPIVEMTEEFLTEDGLENSSAKILNPGVVLLAMYGATAGAVSILGISASTNQAICAIDSHGRLDSIYLADYLRLITPALLAKRIGGAQPNLTQDIIRNILIPVPDEGAQYSYVSFRKKMADVAAVFSGSMLAVSRLDASFSQQAFALDSGL